MAKKIALLIANDQYTDRKLASLAVPASDVKALQVVLANKDVCDFDDIKVLLNATMEEVMLAIGGLFSNKHRDDFLLLYISGHGLVDYAGDLYFALNKTRFTQLLGTALPSSFVKEALNKSKSRRQLLILDCCHSGAFQRGTKGVGAAAINEATFEVNGYGREILASSAATQLSWEGSQIIGDTDKSLFTHYVVEGLATGNAAPQGAEQITVEQLYQYTHDKVVQVKPEMKPQRWVDRQQGSLVIARNPKPLIKPATLPEEWSEVLHSDNYLSRGAAVDKLAEWLSSDNPERILAAEQALTGLMARERDKDVYNKVQQVLGAHADSSQRSAIIAQPEQKADISSPLSSKPIPDATGKPSKIEFRASYGYGAVSLILVLVVALVFNLDSEKPGESANTLPTQQQNTDRPSEDDAIRQDQLKLKQQQEKTRKLLAQAEQKNRQNELKLGTQKISSLLSQAELALQAQRLTTPGNDNAVAYYNQVLELEPNHQAATQGLEQVVQQYLTWAQNAMEQGDITQAGKNLDKAEAVLPQYAGTRQLRVRLASVKKNLVTSSTPKTTAKPGSVFRDNLNMGGKGPPMVVIPAGKFTMGSPSTEKGSDTDERPQHTVTIAQPFALGQHEVTRGEFQRFVTASHYQTDAEKSGGCYSLKDGKWTQDATYSWRNPGFEQTDEHPVVCVSWNDAKAYIDWLNRQTGGGYRFPSEAEWEYAARADTATARYWSDKPEDACEFAIVHDKSHDCSDGFIYTAPVGSKKTNAFALYDMLGNVWEWTKDCWNSTYDGAPDDGSVWTKGDCGLRVLRGGSWDIKPWYVRSALRYRFPTGYRNTYVGFRLARKL